MGIAAVQLLYDCVAADIGRQVQAVAAIHAVPIAAFCSLPAQLLQTCHSE
jgi:hypothetical protein